MGNKPNLAKNALLNTVKQCCAILFPLITFPYVSRVIGTENYGKITFGNSIISYITMVATLGIAQYSIREGAKKRDNKKELNETVNEIFTINMLSTVVAFIIFAVLMVLWPKLAGYRVLLLVQVSSVLFVTLGTDWINSIFEDYRILTIRYIVFHGISIFFMFLFVRKEEDYIIYAAICVLAAIIPNILNIFYVRKNYGIRLKLVKPTEAKKHLKPIMILFASSIASFIYVNSDVTILGIFKDDNEVGLYGAAAKIYTLVKKVIDAFLFVAIPKVSSELAKGLKEKANQQLNSVLKVLISFVLPICTGMFLLSQNIVLLISGDKFAGAETSLSILAVSLVFSALAIFYVSLVLIPLGKEKIILIATIVSAVANIVLNFILIPFWGRDAAALTTVISEVIMVVYGIIYSVKDYKFNIVRALISGIVASLGVAGLYFGTSFMGLGSVVQLFVCIAGAAVWYLLVMAVINKEDLKALVKTFKK